MSPGALQIRQKRNCGPKVRSGCITCKIRRVKCDEAHPSCNKCVSTGRRCDGYNFNQIVNGSGEKGPFGVFIVRPLPPISSVLGTPTEKRGFGYFQSKTAPALSGYYSSDFWESLVLQASFREPSLRHAVIAIGQLHEDFTEKKYDYLIDHRGFAIEQYAKAIAALRRELNAGKQAPVTALMSCILFICFDSVLGRFSSAMVHLQSGLKIIRDTRLRAKCSAADQHLIENTIAPLFIRLSVQAILYVDTRSPADRRDFSFELMKTNERDVPIPTSFESLEEARNHLNQAAEGLFRMFYMCDGSVPWSYQPAEAMMLEIKYSKRLSEWNAAYEKFMAVKGKTLDSRQLRGAVLLKIQHTTISIMAEVSPSNMDDTRSCQEAANDPAAFANLDCSFITIVKLCRSLINAAETDAQAGNATLTFSTETGVIAPLYYVCTHSQSRETREAALALLMRAPRREGMWDSLATVKMVKEFWLNEELHQELQERSGSDTGMTVALSEVLNLEMFDGMQWEWKWKLCSSASTPLRPDQSVRWTQSLGDDSMYGDFYQQADSSPGSS